MIIFLIIVAMVAVSALTIAIYLWRRHDQTVSLLQDFIRNHSTPK